MISRIIKVEVGVIGRSWRLRLLTLTKTCNKKKYCFIIHWIKKMVTTVRGTDNLFPIMWKYLMFSHFFLFLVISKQLICHLRRPFCVLWVLVFNYFFRCLARSTKQTWKSCFCFFTDSKQHKARELDMITLRNHAPQSYMTWLPMTLSVLDMIFV